MLDGEARRKRIGRGGRETGDERGRGVARCLQIALVAHSTSLPYFLRITCRLAIRYHDYYDILQSLIAYSSAGPEILQNDPHLLSISIVVW